MPATSLAPAMRLGSYQITGFLGSGGMGEVYQARDTNLDRVVALKLLPIELAADPERLRRFEDEARMASALSHPAVVTIYEAGQIGSQPYISMELVTGQTLRELVNAGALSLRKVLRIAGQVADGLAAAHEAGLVHRDLKPENIRITTDGFAKILDFGLAKRVHAADGDPARAATHLSAPTQPGTVLGTVGYMSPEQASGNAADARSDQFSFGAVLYETLTSQRAFDGATIAETLSAIIHGEPVPIARLNPRVPPPVRWIVERCLAKHPEDRYALTRDLARDLASAREHLPELLAARTHPVPRPGEPSSIVVLPVVNHSPDVLAASVADAFADALITQLTSAGNLSVVSQSATRALQARPQPLREIAHELGVRWALAASIARMGTVVRISAQLIDTESETNRWGHSYSRRPRNLLACQDEVAVAIARAVAAAIAGGRSRRVKP